MSKVDKAKMDKYMYNLIEETLISLWKQGKVVRSSNPDTKTGEYYYTQPSKAKAATKNRPELGDYLTYEEFQSQIN
jgi:hypothetical protein